MSLPKFRLSLCSLALLLSVALTAAACGDDDGGDTCVDPCDQLGAIRCYGTILQSCKIAPDDCQIWGADLDCSAQGLICMTPATGPECGMLCTDPCSAGMSQCSADTWQTCEADQWGCLSWEDFQHCDDTSLVCDDTTGDASCYAP